ncbi:hypothetical protein [Methylibium sp. Root1272]|uniref:hypothetical protein n=1 Tax=Methylibium sp. Root1272 TaxID=1736441 RepID=UPI001F2ED7A0|nr:hypothetical protein [Methylibium sp. Root1272]
MPGLVLGFHGCDRSHGEAVLSSGKHLRTSSNSHDWLGEGIYFWENDPWRAHDWAWEAKLKPAQVAGSIDEPFVVGAIIDLGHCCNLLDLERSEELERAFNFISQIYAAAGRPMPENDLGPDRVRRYRDRIVVKAMHDLRREEGLTPFQSVRAAFFEGPELYENAGFRKKNHIQIAVCDPNCIKGYFRLPGL